MAPGESFTGGFVVARPGAAPRSAYGPRTVTAGLTAVMRSATGFTPTEAPHVQQSELCATCHTLITHALGPKGEVVGELDVFDGSILDLHPFMTKDHVRDTLFDP